jgi:heme/copper-type cytochrome/quinol oxidase subunit 1
MAVQNRCSCPRCTIRSFMGPAVVITIGVLFLLHEIRDGAFEFGNTYPFILIVIGAILLASSMAPMTGHIEAVTAVPPPPAPPSRPGTTPTQTSFTGPGQ